MYKQPSTQSTQNETNQVNSNFEISAEQLEALRNQARQKAKETSHRWVQRGVYLVCTSCEMEQAIIS